MKLRSADWIKQLNTQLPAFLRSLQVNQQPGRYYPCENGATPVGREMALGFSCFALKTCWTLNLWAALPPAQQHAWIKFIRAFQHSSGQGVEAAAFIDPPLIEALKGHVSWQRRVRHFLRPPRQPMYWQQVVLAETKQAIASLAQVNAQPVAPYHGFPAGPAEIENFLAQLDWSKPWGAGGQASALAVFIQTQLPQFAPAPDVKTSAELIYNFFSTLANKETGAYFNGNQPPEYGQLINGAMKVLTALDWLDAPIHYPEALIDTCLAQKPSPEGCHLVDAVYVLYRCVKQTAHRRLEIRDYCQDILGMIAQHHNPDGGFSYFIGRSQTDYYGAKISRGLPESDIHGTCLLVWALAMILEICETNGCNWQVIKP